MEGRRSDPDNICLTVSVLAISHSVQRHTNSVVQLCRCFSSCTARRTDYCPLDQWSSSRMSDLDIALGLISGLLVALDLSTGLLQSREYLPSEPIVAVGYGVAIGPQGLDAVQLSTWADPLIVIEQAARLTVALAVTSIALRLPENYFRRRWKSMAALLGPGMVSMWLVSGLIAYAVLPVSFVVAMLIGAVITPTDPVLANSVVIGRTAEGNIPKRLRYLLSAEAGANDGGAYLLVFLAVLLAGESIR